MRSPRYTPAGLLIEYAGQRVAFDGGGGPLSGLDAWLVTTTKLIDVVLRHNPVL